MRCAPAAAFLLLSTLTLSLTGPGRGDDTPAKQEKDSKPAKDESQFNSPPKGAVLVSIGRLAGRITKGSDGKTFSMDTTINGQKKEIEINLAAYTKVKIARTSEFDDKGNPKKSAPVVTAGTYDDLRGGMTVTVTVSGTRDGKWLVAKLATITGD